MSAQQIVIRWRESVAVEALINCILGSARIRVFDTILPCKYALAWLLCQHGTVEYLNSWQK